MGQPSDRQLSETVLGAIAHELRLIEHKTARCSNSLNYECRLLDPASPFRNIASDLVAIKSRLTRLSEMLHNHGY